MSGTFLSRIKHLKESWPNPDGCVDSDVAEFELGVVLGIFKEEAWRESRWILNTNNPVSTFLCNTLVQMTELGFLSGDVGAEGVWMGGEPESVFEIMKEPPDEKPTGWKVREAIGTGVIMGMGK